MRCMAVAVLVVIASAQRVNHPTPGLPRTADGKPNLAAPVPRTPDGKPDLPGLWDMRVGNGFNIGTDLKPGKMLPWAEAP